MRTKSGLEIPFHGGKDHARLVLRLFKDSKVSMILKIFTVVLPVLFAGMYLFFPVDLIPDQAALCCGLGFFDDAIVMATVWYTTYLFVEWSPKNIVEKYKNEIINEKNQP